MRSNEETQRKSRRNDTMKQRKEKKSSESDRQERTSEKESKDKEKALAGQIAGNTLSEREINSESVRERRYIF